MMAALMLATPIALVVNQSLSEYLAGAVNAYVDELMNARAGN